MAKLASKTRSVNVRSEALILEAYYKCALREGVANVTLEKVAKESKLAFGTVRYHFSKPETSLHIAAAEDVVIKFQNFIQEQLDSFEENPKRSKDSILLHYARVNLDWIKLHPAYGSYFCYLVYEGSRDGKQMSFFLKRGLDRILTILHKDFERNLITRDKVNRSNAHQVQALILGSAIQLVLRLHEPISYSEHCKQLEVSLADFIKIKR